MGERRVVITGVGTINPLGKSVAEFFANLEKGVSGVGPITQFDTSKFKTHFAGEVKDYNPEDFFDRKQLRQHDRFTQFALIAAEQAVLDSGIDLETTDKDMFGCIWGSGIGGLDTFFHEVKDYVEGGEIPRFSPFFIPRMISDMAAGQISIKYGITGPNYCTVSACSSANHAMIDAANFIRMGKADIMVTGGSEAPITVPGLGGFNSMKALSTRNDSPETASRPFDVDRDGFVMAEGAGALIFEELEHAKARGAKIYAEVCGSGLGADAYHFTAPHPEGMGARRAMEMAMADAGITHREIDYINVHGTSTPLGDLPELKAIGDIFGDDAYRINISATKSMTGHLLGAAGAVEALVCILALDKGIIAPTINVTTVDPVIDQKLNLTIGKPQHRDVRYAMSNAFGFGGHNSSVIFGKY